MKKIIVHKLTISQHNSKILFQIKLPPNAKKITAIKITSNAIKTIP